ncbi:aldehyde dehydrogenase family protein [Streptomyces sp. NPDC053728]|uniref:aldehyde dehydrogenase family protein n=1 Tax=Streptomyces sp. NPDC053728 TaxID=3155534 RepID=UPI0034470849
MSRASGEEPGAPWARAAAADTGMPEGVFSLLVGDGTGTGTRLVRDPRIQAVGFTGSRTAGLALMRAAAQRPQPIPVESDLADARAPLPLLERRAGRVLFHGWPTGAAAAMRNPEGNEFDVV